MSREEQGREEYALRINTAPTLQRGARWNRPGIDLETPRISPAGKIVPLGVPGNFPDTARSNVRGYTSRIDVTPESQMILAADPDRKFLFFQNEDALGSVRIAFGVVATLDTGIRLAPGGGGILLDHNVPTTDVFIIGDVASNPNVTMVVA